MEIMPVSGLNQTAFTNTNIANSVAAGGDMNLPCIHALEELRRAYKSKITLYQEEIDVVAGDIHTRYNEGGIIQRQRIQRQSIPRIDVTVSGWPIQEGLLQRLWMA